MISVTYRKAWCNECFADCYFSHDAQTGQTKHIGAGTIKLHDAMEPLKRQGAYVKHLGHGDYNVTLYKAAPLTLPLTWQMALQLADSREVAIDQYQDW